MMLLYTAEYSDAAEKNEETIQKMDRLWICDTQRHRQTNREIIYRPLLFDFKDLDSVDRSIDWFYNWKKFQLEKQILIFMKSKIVTSSFVFVFVSLDCRTSKIQKRKANQPNRIDHSNNFFFMNKSWNWNRIQQENVNH